MKTHLAVVGRLGTDGELAKGLDDRGEFRSPAAAERLR